MRGIKINPTERTIEEVDVPNPNKSLQGLYDLIGCDLVQLVELDCGIIMVCDEEAKCKPVTGAFTFYGTDLIIAGNAVILGGNANRFAKLHEDIANLKKSSTGSNRRTCRSPDSPSSRSPTKGTEKCQTDSSQQNFATDATPRLKEKQDK